MTKKKRISKPIFDIEEQVDNLFWNFDFTGSNGIRLRRIRNITHNITSFPFPLEEKESWLDWIVKIYGVSRRTAREYLKDAQIMTYRLIDKIGEKIDLLKKR